VSFADFNLHLVERALARQLVSPAPHAAHYKGLLASSDIDIPTIRAVAETASVGNLFASLLFSFEHTGVLAHSARPSLGAKWDRHTIFGKCS
jgi:hypothetical protein